MTDTTLKPIRTRPDTLPSLNKAEGHSAQSAEHTAAPVDSAATVTLPRAHSGAAPAGSPAKALDSLVESIRSSADATGAHGGLEASRVFDLLSDD